MDRGRMKRPFPRISPERGEPQLPPISSTLIPTRLPGINRFFLKIKGLLILTKQICSKF